MSTKNRLGNVGNRFQGSNKRVLCVCSAGLLRSPTAAWVFSNEPYNFNTRAAGAVKEYALIPVDEVLIEWADEIVCMEEEHAQAIGLLMPVEYWSRTLRPIVTLGVPDNYGYRDKELIQFIKTRYKELTGVGE